MSTDVLLGLGSSLGDRNRHLQLALRFLRVHKDIEISQISRIYKSVPLGRADSLFWNLCCTIKNRTLSTRLIVCDQRDRKKSRKEKSEEMVESSH